MTIDNTHDIKLRQNENGVFDINFVDGDFELDDTFYINIILSLFCDAGADESEVSEPIRRRGFFGDLILYEQEDNISLGSKNWLVYGRRTQSELNRYIDYSKQSLQWLIEKNHCKDIEVNGNLLINGLNIKIKFIIDDNSISEFNFNLWENGVVEVIESL